ncbi:MULTISPECIES: YgaP family membrane protein [Flavobacteriaceae]|uniref:DUF2892 domain-containing protein n=2 Tax=Flavobacteriaceae TaxID=49546 RepID=A0A4Y8AWW0_9FLAO|nr:MULTISPECIES: DUF2892 domain-containing protein [Flavobacteriaceae]TEW76981.1 DUF2892 domain-containing protein [Gramella jeungdoensis]GGK58850.1 membrane protein [Lutibacter litoralis]
MKKNVGNADKLVRILIALAIVVLYYTNIITGMLAIVLMAVGIVLLLTVLFNFCPLYSILGIKTCKTPK